MNHQGTKNTKWKWGLAGGALLAGVLFVGLGATSTAPNLLQVFGTNTSFGWFSRMSFSNANLRTSGGIIYVTPLGSGGGSGTGSFNFASSQFTVDNATQVTISAGAPFTNTIVRASATTARSLDVGPIIGQTNDAIRVQNTNSAAQPAFVVRPNTSRVGIGTNAPAYPLDVMGAGYFHGDLTASANLGGTEAIITTNIWLGFSGPNKARLFASTNDYRMGWTNGDVFFIYTLGTRKVSMGSISYTFGDDVVTNAGTSYFEHTRPRDTAVYDLGTIDLYWRTGYIAHIRSADMLIDTFVNSATANISGLLTNAGQRVGTLQVMGNSTNIGNMLISGGLTNGGATLLQGEVRFSDSGFTGTDTVLKRNGNSSQLTTATLTVSSASNLAGIHNITSAGTNTAAAFVGVGGPGVLQVDDAYVNTNISARSITLTNGLAQIPSTVSGVGGANTNFTLQKDSGVIYVDAATTNVNIVAIMGGEATRQWRGIIIATNRGGTSRAFSLGATTNNWIGLQGYDGLAAPYTVTNATALWFAWEMLGTNVYYAAKHMANPSN